MGKSGNTCTFWKPAQPCILFHFQLTNSVEQNPPSEATICSAGQEIPKLLGKLEVHYCVHKVLITGPYSGADEHGHNPISYCFKIHYDIIHPNTLQVWGFV
jgi:hypothetical protein